MARRRRAVRGSALALRAAADVTRLLALAVSVQRGHRRSSDAKQTIFVPKGMKRQQRAISGANGPSAVAKKASATASRRTIGYILAVER